MTNFYVVTDAQTHNITVKRYLTGPFNPDLGDYISHNTVPLCQITAVVGSPQSDNWVLTPDRALPYILIGTILSIGRE